MKQIWKLKDANICAHNVCQTIIRLNLGFERLPIKCFPMGLPLKTSLQNRAPLLKLDRMTQNVSNNSDEI